MSFNENDEIEENKINLTKNNIAYNVGFLNEKFVFIEIFSKDGGYIEVTV